MKLVLIGAVILLALVIAYTLRKTDKIKANPVRTTARITAIRSAYKEQNKRIFDYKFTVDGIKYKGSFKAKRFGSELRVGSEVLVVYEKGNPSNSTIEK